MKRRVFTIMVFLLLGAIVNVAVAWGFAWMLQPTMAIRNSGTRDVSIFFEGERAGLKRCAAIKIAQNGPFQTQRIIRDGHVFTATGRGFNVETTVTHAAGWPMLSMMRSGMVTSASMPPLNSLPRERRLFTPIWPGFAINTVFYAVILWGLFAAPFALRRRIRIRRGLCPACAYPVGDCPVCTECGKQVKA